MRQHLLQPGCGAVNLPHGKPPLCWLCRVCPCWGTPLRCSTSACTALIWWPCLLQSVLESHIEALPGDPKKKSANNGEVVAKLHQVEKHIRKNKLKVGRIVCSDDVVLHLRDGWQGKTRLQGAMLSTGQASHAHTSSAPSLGLDTTSAF